MKKLKKVFLKTIAVLAILYFILLIPDFKVDTNIITAAGKSPFAWNRDAFWKQREQEFIHSRQMPPAYTDSVTAQLKIAAEALYQRYNAGNHSYADSLLPVIENNFFTLADLVAARPQNTAWLLEYYNKVRRSIKQSSQYWNMNDTAVKNAMYKLLYGMGAATEEVLLQTDSIHFTPAMMVTDEPSSTPSTSIFGITVHSGDLLVSRGGAEVSALVSRGNDYPGNFSHVALIYIDEKTNIPYLIEAHIEKGVAISSVEQYIKDKKLRFMVMRLRHDLPAMQKDALLPQKVAKDMFNLAQRQHIPYDFKMNFYDTTSMFCSEVGSYGYRRHGIQLWQNISTISSKGVINWLSDFGVEHFVTQMPSDLEYDPQLSIVAEWRDPETLYKDHIDNAAMDALLEKANSGATIDYNTWMLPIARTIKAWCWIKNRFGGVGMIPEGMSATKALKNQRFVAMHQQVKNEVEKRAKAFQQQNGYRPPYWQLVQFANEAAKDL
ncbi:MAG: hypothetical protein JST86_07150 [Bacteroidetes bacterium]|nr:hypothetical protein [Bacteroidota bacterium]